MIEIRDLGMAYELDSGRLEVLSGVELSLGSGQTAAIVGPSGSGKTTLLVLLAGLEEPQNGSIRVDERDITRLDGDALADFRRDHLGIIFQSFHLVPSLTALGNVSLPLQIGGHTDFRQRASDMLDRVGLGQRLHHYPSQLSGGEQQRVAIARALIHQPKLILADEPTGSLDRRTGEKIIDLLFELHVDSGSTMVLVTHDDAIAGRCERVLRLRDGALREDDIHAAPA